MCAFILYFNVLHFLSNNKWW